MTTGFLHTLISTARMVRHTSGLAEGLTADDEMLLDAPDALLAPALVAAGRGEYEPTARLLAATREAAEWENRDRYTLRLAVFARQRPDWLRAWRAAAPRDPDAALVHAQLAVDRAWDSPVRTELLVEASPLVAAAADGDPLDPVPWRIALDHARGTHAPRPDFEKLWGEAVRRSPHHYGCHVAVLQYLSAAWHGSHQECFDFAERAAGDALPGSLIQALPVRAALAAELAGELGSVPRERLDRAVRLAVALSAAYPAGDPWPAEVRNLLAYVLFALERWGDTLEEFRRIGPHVTSFPWAYMSDDPLGQFLELRDGVRIQIATSMPFRGRGN